MLRYEDFSNQKHKVETGLRDFIIDKAIENEQLAHSFHWHLFLAKDQETPDPIVQEYYQRTYDDLMAELRIDSPRVYQDIVSTIEFR